MYFLYSALTAAGLVLLAPYFVALGLRRGKYLHNLRERLGAVPREITARAEGAPESIWIHAVSVGETLAAVPLAERLKQRFPGVPLFISTTTATGQAVARERVKAADGVFYFPLDWSASVRRVFRAVRPAIVIILETEIWPNFLREARRRGVPVVFANARVSAGSFRRYRGVNRWLGNFVGRALGDAAAFLAQSDTDAQRLLELGAPADRVEVAGNLKYDLGPPSQSAFVAWLEEQVKQQERWPVVVAGSVVEDEEEPVLAAYDIVQRQWRRALLVLAPRKPERFEAAGQIAAERGWKVARRSRLDEQGSLGEDVDVLLLDSIGELAGLYALADAVFVGGSLVAAGGHNILEPAWFAKPPVFGPSMDNFRDMATEFLSVGAGAQVGSGEKLGKFWVRLIKDDRGRERMGLAAQELAQRNRGATERCALRITAILEERCKQR
jgi:3-deoxy-D-manno-octulosonic-acid transferase